MLVCGLWAIQTWNYIPVFKNAESMWTRALARDANCYPAQLGLARARLDQGKADDAIAHYAAAARIHPDRCEGYAGLGAAAIRLERWDDARTALDRALAAQPRFVPALIDRASVAERDRDVALARTLLSTAVSQEPNHALAQLRLGGVLLRTGATAEALATFETVVRLRPSDPSGYQGVAEASKLLGRWDAALSAARTGLSVRPSHLSLKNLLAVILATCPDDRLRNGPEAVRLAEEVVQALGPADFHGPETLAAALAETGQFDAAASRAREAARLARTAGREDAAKANERWASQFEARQPRRG